jgi:hypothetical protein
VLAALAKKRRKAEKAARLEQAQVRLPAALITLYSFEPFNASLHLGSTCAPPGLWLCVCVLEQAARVLLLVQESVCMARLEQALVGSSVTNTLQEEEALATLCGRSGHGVIMTEW